MSATQVKMERPTVFKLNNKIKEFEAKNVELEKQIEHFKLISADHSRALDDASELEKKLEIAVTCLKELRPVIEQGEDWELGKWIEKALTEINGDV